MKCDICEIGCNIASGETGKCGMYTCGNGSIHERFPDSYLAVIPISIETMPLTHYRPRSKFLQVGGIGCNFSCKGCVSGLFTRNAGQFAPALKTYPVEEIVKKAIEQGCEGIVCCMNDPVVSHHTFMRLAAAAKSAGLAVGCSTNGYHTSSALAEVAAAVDFVNCGLKGGSDGAYRQCGAPTAEPVFRNLRVLHDSGVHVEVSVIYSKENEAEVLEAARRVASISPEIPFQVMRFVPFGDAPMELEPTVRASEALCRELRKTLSFVYLFNSPGTPYLNIECPQCGTTLFHREFYGPMGCRTVACAPEGSCFCGYRLPITGAINSASYNEYGMMGGYRFTRGLEIIRAICGCLGIDTGPEISHVWQSVIQNNDVEALHDKINRIDSYLDLITELGVRFGREFRAKAVTEHMRERVMFIEEKTKFLERPTVYYAMCTPGFALNGERFEIQLAETAGGRCVNGQLVRSGKPGVNISKEELLYLNPEHIFISGLFSAPEQDFYETCHKEGLWIDAVTSRRIHSIPAGWDFGNPRWILGLMHMANILHPECFDFDLISEAELLYRKFWGSTQDSFVTNRSFYQPLKAWAS